MENSSNGQGDALRRERMLSLKRSRAGHLGYLNRLYKDVELLMQNAIIIMGLVRRRKMLISRLRDVFKPTTNIINSPSTPKSN